MTLSELRLLCERATQGPWLVEALSDPARGNERVVVSDPHAAYGGIVAAGLKNHENAAFIAAARTWLPALIEVAEAARTVGTFDDFGDPEALCPECSPAHPQPFMDARMALHAALARLDEVT